MAKLTGIVILLVPNRLLRLKEWVFAGLFFDIVFAFVSKASVLGLTSTVDAVIAFVMVGVTYFSYHKIYQASGEIAA